MRIIRKKKANEKLTYIPGWDRNPEKKIKEKRKRKKRIREE